ncbi:putative inactive purple acid phosphatase 24 [Nymphaea thermarum]|nr:putative inactive purple acid phosphatase 24 [Nymphaea thermarum]
MFLCPRSSASNQKNPLLHFSFTIVTLTFLIFFFFTKPTSCLTERGLEAYSSIPAAKFQLKNFGSSLIGCSVINPYLRIDVSIEGPLRDEENITVTVSGVLVPSDLMWVGLVSPPDVETDIGFVLFHGGFDAPCVLKRSNTLRFDNPLMPLYPHLSSLDSTSTSMRVTWVSGDDTPQQVKYGNGMSATSTVTTFTKDDLCSGNLQSPAMGFGWHDPGYIHSAVMTGLEPLHSYSYRYGRDYVNSNSVYITPDSGGECGVAYETYFQMPTTKKDEPWYSIEQAGVHFTVISTEHSWIRGISMDRKRLGFRESDKDTMANTYRVGNLLK